MPRSQVALSVVVVTHDMARELPRTLRSLANPYQREIQASDYEVVVVDNGSTPPVASTLPSDLLDLVHVHRIERGSPSPAQAANTGLALARGDLIGLVVDGARLASPGLLAMARRAMRVDPRAVVTAPAWHLGPHLHMDAAAAGYDQTVEDELLAESGWEEDGYGLFSISTPAASSSRGLFGSMGESSSLFMARTLWDEVGGLDGRFELPGGGMVNHDLYRRACALPDTVLVVLLGEGTFHQVHGGAATSGRVTTETMRDDYERIRGEPHRPPTRAPVFLGSVPVRYLPHVRASADRAMAKARAEGPRGSVP